MLRPHEYYQLQYNLRQLANRLLCQMLHRIEHELNQKHNIQKELNMLKSKLDVFYFNDELYDQLQHANSKLWNLEDNIRQKSKKNEYDDQYISFAENIHKTNDLRASIKKQLNLKYKSNIIEEKIY